MIINDNEEMSSRCFDEIANDAKSKYMRETENFLY